MYSKKKTYSIKNIIQNIKTYFEPEFITGILAVGASFNLEVNYIDNIDIYVFLIGLFMIFLWLKKVFKRNNILKNWYKTIGIIYDIKSLWRDRFKLFINFVDEFWSKISFSEEKYISIFSYPKDFWRDKLSIKNKWSYSLVDFIINNKAKINVIYNMKNSKLAIIDNNFKFIFDNNIKEELKIINSDVEKEDEYTDKVPEKKKELSNKILNINKSKSLFKKVIIWITFIIISLLLLKYIDYILNINANEPVQWIFVLLLSMVILPLSFILLLFWAIFLISTLSLIQNLFIYSFFKNNITYYYIGIFEICISFILLTYIFFYKIDNYNIISIISVIYENLNILYIILFIIYLLFSWVGLIKTKRLKK